jgi:polyhydroxyalkanoate synthesis repressor PhaR
MTRKPIIIKKYENRRLYDATNSRYVNLDEIARMIRDGYELQVLDAATGEDLTRLVLTQIIVEEAKGPGSGFPLDVLRQMIVASGKATQENTLKYMKAIVDMYQNAYRAFTPVVNPFEFIQPSPRPVPSTAEPPAPAVGEESGLRRRVEELETLIAKMGEGKIGEKKRSSSRKKSATPRRKSHRKS